MATNSPANPQAIQRLIQALNNGQLAQAESEAKHLISQHADTFVLHHVLALALDGQGKFAEAVTSYQQAIKLQPKTADLHFNCGIALANINQLAAAEASYREAIRLNANFFEAHGSLGACLQRQGKLDEAIESYLTGLKINAQDARGHFNLGTALRDKGALDEAIKSYLKAISLFPNYTDAHNNVGETFRDQGNMQAAVKAYQAALSLNPQHARANYNMAEFLVMSQKLDDAIAYFETSQLDDWQTRILYCLYKSKKFDDFKTKRADFMRQAPHTSPFLATLSTHYSLNFNEPDPYNFCKNGLDFVYHKAMPALAANSPLLLALLNDIHHADIAERKQGRLTNGQQSAGNLFKRPEASFQQLAELIKQAFLAYQQTFAGADCELIQSFPSELEFTSSWYVKMQSGGHLSAHIHEIGWISGAVYLAMPASDGNAGAFEYGLHGDDYPMLGAQFSAKSVLPKVGDIILFPSSLFHRSIPFDSSQERICIAFDLKPASSLTIKK